MFAIVGFAVLALLGFAFGDNCSVVITPCDRTWKSPKTQTFAYVGVPPTFVQIQSYWDKNHACVGVDPTTGKVVLSSEACSTKGSVWSFEHLKLPGWYKNEEDGNCLTVVVENPTPVDVKGINCTTCKNLVVDESRPGSYDLLCVHKFKCSTNTTRSLTCAECFTVCEAAEGVRDCADVCSPTGGAGKVACTGPVPARQPILTTRPCCKNCTADQIHQQQFIEPPISSDPYNTFKSNVADWCLTRVGTDGPC